MILAHVENPLFMNREELGELYGEAKLDHLDFIYLSCFTFMGAGQNLIDSRDYWIFVLQAGLSTTNGEGSQLLQQEFEEHGQQQIEHWLKEMRHGFLTV